MQGDNRYKKSSIYPTDIVNTAFYGRIYGKKRRIAKMQKIALSENQTH